MTISITRPLRRFLLSGCLLFLPVALLQGTGCQTLQPAEQLRANLPPAFRSGTQAGDASPVIMVPRHSRPALRARALMGAFSSAGTAWGLSYGTVADPAELEAAGLLPHRFVDPDGVPQPLVFGDEAPAESGMIAIRREGTVYHFSLPAHTTPVCLPGASQGIPGSRKTDMAGWLPAPGQVSHRPVSRFRNGLTLDYVMRGLLGNYFRETNSFPAEGPAFLAALGLVPANHELLPLEGNPPPTGATLELALDRSRNLLRSTWTDTRDRPTFYERVYHFTGPGTPYVSGTPLERSQIPASAQWTTCLRAWFPD